MSPRTSSAGRHVNTAGAAFLHGALPPELVHSLGRALPQSNDVLAFAVARGFKETTAGSNRSINDEGANAQLIESICPRVLVSVCGMLQGMYFRFQCDNCVYKTYQMRIVPEFLLPQPHHHLGNMYQYSNQVIYTKLQHCDTLSAVFAHVASRLATTDYHRSTQTARATVNMSDN